jgi:hypothetical protein
MTNTGLTFSTDMSADGGFGGFDAFGGMDGTDPGMLGDLNFDMTGAYNFDMGDPSTYGPGPDGFSAGELGNFDDFFNFGGDGGDAIGDLTKATE